MADFWHAFMASASRKGGDISWGNVVHDMMEHAPADIAVFDDKMRYLAVSRQFLSDYELGEPAQVVGRSIYETFPDMPLARLMSECWRARNWIATRTFSRARTAASNMHGGR
jgi:hypothetical protein